MYAKVLIAELSKLVKICFREWEKIVIFNRMPGNIIIMLVYYHVFGPHLRFSKNKLVSWTFIKCARGLVFLNVFYYYERNVMHYKIYVREREKPRRPHNFVPKSPSQ